MRITKAISTVEVHTGGEAFRIVTSGLPRMPGKTIVARRAWLKENADHIRRALMFEPRGHADMYGGYLTEPVSENADFGVIFVHNEGYSDHCGHGVIGLANGRRRARVDRADVAGNACGYRRANAASSRRSCNGTANTRGMSGS